MKLTSVGLRNYLDKTRARRDAREQAIMDIYAKHGPAGLGKIFPMGIGSTNSKRYTSTGSKTDDITQTSLSPVIGESESAYTFPMSAEESNYMKTLQKDYGLDDDTAARFMANGDPTVFKRLYEKVNEAQKFYQEQDKPFANSPVSEKFIGEIISGSVDQAASPSGRIDINKVESYIGRELDGLYKSILQQQEMPRGQVLLGDRFLGEDFTQTEVTNFVNSATSSTALLAGRQINVLSDKIKSLNDIKEGYIVDPTGKRTKTTPRNLTEAEVIERDFYINYQQQLNSAREAFEDNQNPLELFEIYGAKGLEEFAKVNPKLLRDPLVNQYLEEAKAREYILTPAIPGRPTELVPYTTDSHRQRLAAGPSAYSFLYQLLYIDNIFTVGDKVAVYDGSLDSPNIIHTYDLTSTKSQ